MVYSLPLRRCRFNAGAQSVEPYGDIIGAVNIDSQAKNAYQTIYESVHGTMINTHLNAIAYSTGLLLGLCHDIKKMGTT